MRLFVSLVVACLLGAACSSQAPTDAVAQTTTQAETTTTEVVVESTTTTAAVEPDEGEVLDDTNQPGVNTPAEDALHFILLMLDDLPTTEQVEEQFSPDFLAQVSADDIIALLPQLTSGASGPFRIEQSDLSEFSGSAEVVAPGVSGYTVQLQVASEAPHLIEGLFFQPLIDLPELASFSAVDAAMADLASFGALGVFELVDGDCVALHANNIDEPLPQGSIFKLWILAELAHQVDAGEVAWDQMIAVEDRYKSSPDGELFELEEGTERTVEEVAGLMISISDNSATDHLLHLVGRERVEARMAELVAAPDLNIPFMSAADLFMLKFDPSPPNSADYRSADVDGRRALLDEMKDQVVPWIGGVDDFPLVNVDGLDLGLPRDHDLEWLATSTDICRTHAHLADLAAMPGLEEVASILSINPTAGMPFDPSVWADLRYKGGSEPGVVAVSWWMQHVDGRQFVLAGSMADPDTAIAAVDGVALLQSAVALID